MELKGLYKNVMLLIYCIYVSPFIQDLQAMYIYTFLAHHAAGLKVLLIMPYLPAIRGDPPLIPNLDLKYIYWGEKTLSKIKKFQETAALCMLGKGETALPRPNLFVTSGYVLEVVQ